jgi:formamidopyrimidine-DNA glycosylase
VPELPDVERFRCLLQDHVVGEKITAVEVVDPGVIRGLSSQDFVNKLEGRRFGLPERRGKWLLAPLNGPTLLFHFGMTGSLVWGLADGGPLSRFDRVIIDVGPGKLVFNDQRKLRGLWLADDEDGISAVTGKLGPDALGLTNSQLEQRLTGRRGALKSALMDQQVVAGLGNMLTDEVLWRARIHPARRFGELAPVERQVLGRALQNVLRASVKVGDIPRHARWLSSQRSRADPKCPRCRTSLVTSRIGGRTSYWCPDCQPSD